MNVIFLDFDGVVNTPYVYQDEQGQEKYKLNMPIHGRVNNQAALKVISKFCKMYNYKIVVSSSWRIDAVIDCSEILYGSGLEKEVEVIGRTPHIPCVDRGDEISKYLEDNPEINNYIIFDDDCDLGNHVKKLVICDPDIGFSLNEFSQAEELHKSFNNGTKR